MNADARTSRRAKNDMWAPFYRRPLNRHSREARHPREAVIPA